MDISKYAGYFHDGGILDIKCKNTEMEIWMESSQLCPEWNEDNVPLSKFETIKGILHIKGIKSILVNDQPTNYIKIIYDSGEISKFKIYRNKVELFILWSNFPPKKSISEFDHIIIEAEQITWENAPNLFDSIESELD